MQRVGAFSEVGSFAVVADSIAANAEAGHNYDGTHFLHHQFIEMAKIIRNYISDRPFATVSTPIEELKPYCSAVFELYIIILRVVTFPEFWKFFSHFTKFHFP